MKITRYTQSCLLIEDNGARILIDPGGADSGKDFGKLDAVLYTHEHGDHFDPQMAQNFVEKGVAPVYVNASTAKQIKASVTVVKNGDKFELSGLEIKAIELPHCLMVDGSAGPQNTGYLINEKIFHPGDGKELAGLEVDNLAVPIAGPDISLKDAFDFAQQVSAKSIIPIHYDMMSAKPDFFVMLSTRFNMPFKIYPLASGESTDI